MNVREFVESLNRRWLVVVGTVLAGVAIAAAIALLSPKSYTSTTQILVSASGGETASAVEDASVYAERLMTTFARLGASPMVLEPALERVGTDEDARSLAERVTVSVPLNTMLLDVSVEAASADAAAADANAVGEALEQAIQEVAPTLDARGSVVTTVTITPASMPASPSAPDWGLFLSFGALVGAFVGLALLLLVRPRRSA